jgi:hypothetical protein
VDEDEKIQVKRDEVLLFLKSIAAGTFTTGR